MIRHVNSWNSYLGIVSRSFLKDDISTWHEHLFMVGQRSFGKRTPKQNNCHVHVRQTSTTKVRSISMSWSTVILSTNGLRLHERNLTSFPLCHVQEGATKDQRIDFRDATRPPKETQVSMGPWQQATIHQHARDLPSAETVPRVDSWAVLPFWQTTTLMHWLSQNNDEKKVHVINARPTPPQKNIPKNFNISKTTEIIRRSWTIVVRAFKLEFWKNTVHVHCISLKTFDYFSSSRCDFLGVSAKIIRCNLLLKTLFENDRCRDRKQSLRGAPVKLLQYSLHESKTSFKFATKCTTLKMMITWLCSKTISLT